MKIIRHPNRRKRRTKNNTLKKKSCFLNMERNRRAEKRSDQWKMIIFFFGSRRGLGCLTFCDDRDRYQKFRSCHCCLYCLLVGLIVRPCLYPMADCLRGWCDCTDVTFIRRLIRTGKNQRTTFSSAGPSSKQCLPYCCCCLLVFFRAVWRCYSD